MKYFNYLSDQDKKELFYKEPGSFTKSESKHKLSYSLGATLYMPGIRGRIGGYHLWSDKRAHVGDYLLRGRH